MNDLYNTTLFFGVVLIAVPTYVAIGLIVAVWSFCHHGLRGLHLPVRILASAGIGAFWFTLGMWCLVDRVRQWRADVCESKSGSQPRGTMTAASPSKNAAIRSELLKQGYRIGGNATESKGPGDTSSSSNWTK